MFSWFRRDRGPEGGRPHAAPGAERETSDDVESPDAGVDVLAILASVMKEHGREVVPRGDLLEDTATGLYFWPQYHGSFPLPNSGFRTVTTIAFRHDNAVPSGCFEYQHGWGATAVDSVRTGFDQWAQTDLVAILESLEPTPPTCMTLQMSFPEKDDRPERHRRAVLGPVAHFPAELPPPNGDEEHPFCACCLLTRTLLAFKDQLEDDDFHGIRLFATRNADGSPAADCRVDGQDWEPGAEALRQYVKTWPGTGFEFRKQYVILQNCEKPAVPDASPNG